MTTELSATDYLTVGELRELLQDLDDDLPVILQKDAEGNGYRVGHGGELAYFHEEDSRSGEVLEYDDLEEWELTCEDVVPCFVVWPL